MGKHGLVTWGSSSKCCYDNTIRIVQEAEDFIQGRRKGRKLSTGTAGGKLSEEQRREVLVKILPPLRGMVSQRQGTVLLVDDCPEVLEFVAGIEANSLSQVGAACPDHLVHTKRQPLFVDWIPAQGVEALLEKLTGRVEAYVADYQDYFKQHRHPKDLMRDPYPRVILIPGLGMIATGTDAQAADVSRQLYQRAIRVMEGSQTLSYFNSLTPQEAYNVEYWHLELYKLNVKPVPRELAGRVAVVTGGASGIGRATARRLAQDGAHVVILDINLESACKVADELTEKHGLLRGMALCCDVTDEATVSQAFEQVVLTYGGVDIVVSNAGIATSAPIEQITLRDWDRTMDILAKGYFLVSREAFRVWKVQKMGGSLVYVASKNALAYNAAKAAELHMARCLAEEGGAYSVRVNSVLPDAVLEGSGIWDAGWRQARASNYGIKPEELDEYCRQRTTLKVNVYPKNVAEAISFLVGSRASRTTGGVIPVDGGVSSSYVR